MPVSNRFRKVANLLLLSCLVATANSFAADARNQRGASQMVPAAVAVGIPIAKQGTHRNSTFGLTVTNYGFLGNQSNPSLRDSFDSLLSVSFEFPLNSKLEYLYQGAFWVGGIVNGDTLVSVGTDGWILDPNRGEIHPSSNQGEVTAQKIGGGAREIIFNFTDTLTDPAFVEQDPADARPHRPLYLSFLQKSFVFTPAIGADSFAIIYLRLQNIGSNTINNLYFGLFMDNDVGYINTPNYFEDDMTGFVDSSLIPGTPLQGDIACIWDNDGDPGGSGQYGLASPTGVTGVKLIGSSQPVTKKSFNWWTPNGTVALDWGPQKAPGRRNVSGGLGQPEGDAMKYYYMSNGEIDYPQVRSAIDYSAQGWLPPLPDPNAARDVANGFDARYLLSYGSFTLVPGDTLTLAFAAAVGKSLHVDPYNFDNNLGPVPSNYLDSSKINRYLRGLHFASLIHNVSLAESLWNSRFQNLALGPPLNVRFTELDDSTARLFLPSPSELEKGFNIYRSTDSNGTYVKANIGTVTSTAFDDSSLSESLKYWYKFSTVSTSGLEGPMGGRIGPVIPGRPHTPTNLADWPDKFGNILLSWQPPADSDLLRFRIYRAPIASSMVFSLIDSVNAGASTYLDPGSMAGQRFWYRITAVDTFGLESFFSDTVRSMRFVFGNKALLVDRTSYYSFRQFAGRTDSISHFYQRLLRRVDFDMLDLSYSSIVDPKFVAQNPVLVIHSSEFLGSWDSSQFLYHFIDYLKAGGKLVVVKHWPINVFSTGTTISLCGDPFSPFESIFNAFGFSCLNLVSDYPWDSSLSSQSFLSAQPKEPAYPVLLADSAKVARFVLNFFDPARTYQYPTVPNVGYLTNSNPSEDLYTFGSILGSSDPKHGQTVAKKHIDANGGGFVWFDFPLYYMQEDSAKKAFRQALADLGVPEDFPKADLNRDGARTVTDVILQINYVFLGEQFPIFDADEADINCDGRTTPADVVLFLRNVFSNQPLPCN